MAEWLMAEWCLATRDCRLETGDCRLVTDDCDPPRSTRLSRARARFAQAARALSPSPRPRRRTEAESDLRSPPGGQPVVQQLPGADDASEAARGGARGDAAPWSGIGVRPH